MADNTESIGGFSVAITGDASQLTTALSAAQSQAQAAGQKIASSLGQGLQETSQKLSIFAALLQQSQTEEGRAAQAAQQLANALRLAGGAATQATPQIQTTVRAAEQISQASKHAVTDIQAVSGTLRTLDGNQGIRAAERFLASIPGIAPALQSIFPVVGAIAFAEILVRMGEHIGKMVGLWGGVTEAEKKTTDQANDLDREIAQIAADIQKLDNATFGAIYGEAALKAREADQAAQGLLHANNNVAASYVQIAAKLKTIDPAQIGAKTRDVITSGHVTFVQQLTDINEIRKAMDALDAHAAHPLTGGSLKNTEKEVEVLREGLLKAELQVEQNQKQATSLAHAANKQLLEDSIAVRNAQAAAAAEKARLQAEAARQEEESERRQIDDILRRKKEQAEADAEAIRGQEELNRAAQQLYDTNRRYNDEVDRGNRLMKIGGVELANKSSEELSGQRPPTRGEQTKQEPVNEGVQQRLVAMGQQRLADEVKLQQAGIQTNNEIQSRIGNIQQEIDAANRLNVPIETRLKLEQEILQAKIQQAAANGQTDQADKLAAANVALQQTLTQWKALDLGDAAQTIEGTLVKIPATLADAISKGIFDHQKGQNVGTDIAKAFAGLGKQLFGELLTDGFEKLIATLLGQGIFASAQTTATTANTAALIANTAAVSTSGGASAAGGIAGGVGSAAGTAGAAAATGGASLIAPIIGGIISGVISAAATFIGDAGIIKAVNATTAAVLSLHQTVATGSTTNGSSQPSLAAPSQSIGGQIAASLFTALTGAGALDVNVVSISPIAIGAGFLHLFGFASGTDSAPGGYAMVGEKGPEIMYVPRGAQITPNHKIGSYAGGTSGARSFSSSSSTSIGELHVHAHGVSNPDAFAKAAVAAIPREIKRQTSKASPYSN